MNYEEIVCDANNLYRAYKVSVKSSKWKESTQRFMMNFLRYIFEIQDDLINRTLQNGPTQEFELHERGRIRPITSIQIRDRIVRHTLCDEVLLPEVKKHIIYDNCASIKGRGISQQRKRFEIFTSITSCTEMMAGFYSVIFQNFMTTSFTRLRNENYWNYLTMMSLLIGF